MIRMGVILCTLATLAAPAWGETRFLKALDDVPLAPGLVEDTDPPLDFPSAEGRIIVVAASGAEPAQTVADFYRTAMPALGWSQAPGAGLVFLRGRERLAILLEEAAPGQILVRFRLVARQAPPVLD